MGHFGGRQGWVSGIWSFASLRLPRAGAARVPLPSRPLGLALVVPAPRRCVPRGLRTAARLEAGRPPGSVEPSAGPAVWVSSATPGGGGSEARFAGWASRPRRAGLQQGRAAVAPRPRRQGRIPDEEGRSGAARAACGIDQRPSGGFLASRLWRSSEPTLKINKKNKFSSRPVARTP